VGVVTDKGEPFILVALYLEEEIQAEIPQTIEPIFEPTSILTDGDLCGILVTNLSLWSSIISASDTMLE